MEFNEKMIFLMKITNTSNKMLSSAINVDPSMISLIRTGRRKKPRNQDHIMAMAEYFATRTTALYQREAIATAVGRYNIRYQTDLQLKDVLFQWMIGREEDTPSSLDQLLLEFNQPLPKQSYKQVITSQTPEIQPTLFYGNEGKFEAIRQTFEYLLSLEKPGVIYHMTDESALWYLNEPDLWLKIRSWKQELASRGFTFCQILPPATSTQFYETLIHWLPLYAAGKVETYYYPRLRDKLYRKTLLLMENEIVMCCDSIATEYETAVTVISRNPRFINAQLRMFKDVTHQCQQTMIAHSTQEAIRDCFSRYALLDADFIQSNPSLPLFLMPENLYAQISELPYTEYYIPSKNVGHYAQSVKNALLHHHGIDICPLASVSAVVEGKVTYHIPGSTDSYTYTPADYRAHLLSIADFMEECPDYDFIPVSSLTDSGEVMLIKKHRQALLIRQADPVSVFEISQTELIEPFYEYLMNKADKVLQSSLSRRTLINRLRNLAEELSAY